MLGIDRSLIFNLQTTLKLPSSVYKSHVNMKTLFWGWTKFMIKYNDRDINLFQNSMMYK